MAFESLLDHECDIYHMRRTDASPGYGLPSSPKFSYGETPDLASVRCHFCTKSGVTVVQMEPQAKYEAKIKLVLPPGVDVRLNDKIVDRHAGYEYTAEIPRTVRNHHIAVLLRRTSAQEAL